MGICNVTPDSFSETPRGKYLDVDAACARVDELIAEGADIVDIGGESTRPGAKPVPADVQLERVLAVVSYAASRSMSDPPDRPICVSIDTTSAKVAAACLDAGAHVVNDVSLLGAQED